MCRHDSKQDLYPFSLFRNKQNLAHIGGQCSWFTTWSSFAIFDGKFFGCGGFMSSCTAGLQHRLCGCECECKRRSERKGREDMESPACITHTTCIIKTIVAPKSLPIAFPFTLPSPS